MESDFSMPELHQSVLPVTRSTPDVRLNAFVLQKLAVLGSMPKLPVSARTAGYLWGLGAAAIWSGWWTVTRIGVINDLPAADLAALRFGVSGFLLIPLAWRERTAICGTSPWLLLLMAAGAGAPYALITGTGVALTSASLGGAMTVGLLPGFTLMLSLLFLREVVTFTLAAGITCILAGAGCVIAGTWNSGHGGYGLGFFVLGALMWAGYTVSLKQAGLRPLTATAVVCVASLALYTPAWLTMSGPAHLLAAAPAELLLQVIYQSLLSAIGAL
jgi:drug/metabolite transporter (DMT)-like permease